MRINDRNQHPQAECVDQGFQLFPEPWYTLMAQFRFWLGSQGAFPPLQPPQLTLLICHKPTSVDPLVLQFMAWAFPPLSWETMHLQQATFQLCFPHQVAMSSINFEFPQQQVWHFPDGQFPPQLSAMLTASSIITTNRYFISYFYFNFIICPFQYSHFNWSPPPIVEGLIFYLSFGTRWMGLEGGRDLDSDVGKDVGWRVGRLKTVGKAGQKLEQQASKVKQFKIIKLNQNEFGMSLVLHIEELIDTLFEHPSFQSKLRSFSELDSLDCSLTKLSKSIHTDVSDPLEEDSQSKFNPELDALATQIQQLLSHTYHKTAHQIEPLEICRILDEIQSIKQQISAIKLQCSHLKDCLDSEKRNETRKFDAQLEYKNWQSQILQKIDIANSRNLKKVQSIFADKLNSFQMSIEQRVGSAKKMANSSLDFNRGLESPPQPEQRQTQLQGKPRNETQAKEAQIMKTLKSVKSLGSLFGLKS